MNWGGVFVAIGLAALASLHPLLWVPLLVYVVWGLTHG